MIRPATDADIPAILAIWNPLIRDTLVTFNAAEKTATELARMLADKATAGLPFFVAEVPGAPELAGLATYGPFRAGVGYARSMEHTVLLGPQARGRGIGRALMAAIEDHARAREVHVMMAGVSGGNPDGRAFHAALGYREVGIVPEAGWKFGRYWDLVLMQKILS